MTALLAIGFLTISNAQEAKQETITTLQVKTTTTNEMPETLRGFAKGDTFATGSLNFNDDSATTSENGVNTTYDTPLNFDLELGHFVSDNIALGGVFGMETSESVTTNNGIFTTTDNFSGRKATAYNTGIFGRYYCSPINRFSVFGELGVNARFLSTGGGGIYDARLSPGLNYAVSDHFLLQTKLGFMSYKFNEVTDNAPNGEGENFSINTNLRDLNLGIVYKF